MNHGIINKKTDQYFEWVRNPVYCKIYGPVCTDTIYVLHQM